MEWTESIRRAVEYMEAHLREGVTPEDVARAVHISPMYLSRGFEILTGYSVSRYLRCRRLYLAALDLTAGKSRVLDVALDYGFETPESFSKAFSRFHGASPTEIMRDHSRIRLFLPLKLVLSIQGGELMDYKVEQREAFQLAGFKRRISYSRGYRECPAFWDEIAERYLDPLMAGKSPETPEEQAVVRYNVGEFAVCEDADDARRLGAFRYVIAGRYDGGPLPQGMTALNFPAGNWAVFPCKGPMPGALQAVNTKIFNEWLPGSSEYVLSGGVSLEWYAQGDCSAQDYESAIWLPVKKK